MEQSDIVDKAQGSLKKLASTGMGMSLTAWDEVSNNLLECTAEITRLRAALAEKMVVKVKPLEWEESLRNEWTGTPAMKLGGLAYWVFRHHDRTFKRATKDGWQYSPTLEAAKAAAQADYDSWTLSAVEAVPASQIRAEALREALAAAIRAIKNGKQSRRDSIAFDVEEAILALIDAPKVTP